MGTLEKYLRLNYDLLLSKAPSVLLGDLNENSIRCGDDVFIHPSAKIMGPEVIGSRCTINQKACIKGPTVIGPDCFIGGGANIEATILWRGVTIGTGASLKNCIVTSNVGVESNDQIANSTITPDKDRDTPIDGSRSPIILGNAPDET